MQIQYSDIRQTIKNVKLFMKIISLTITVTIMTFLTLNLSGCRQITKSLSNEEISTFNTDFFNSEMNNMNNMLLSSEFCNPEEIDLFQLFYNGVSTVEEQISEDEVALLTELCSEASYLDIVKVTVNEMDTFLQEKLGIGLEETQKIGLDSFYYLEDYESYYLIAGDTNFDWCTIVSGAWETDNILSLKYEKKSEKGQWIVTLKKTNEGYLFVSNIKMN